jgi:hypothetical protein
MISPNGMDLNAWKPKPRSQAGRTRNAGGITGPYDGTRRAAGGAIVQGTNPGRAQSQQSPYANSTAYGQPVSNTPNVQGGQMHSFYSQPAGQGRPATPAGPSATNSPAPYQAYSPATQQAQAPSQPAQAPAFQQQMPSFQFAGGTDWMGNQYTDPNAMMAQTGAMAQALNQQRQGMMGQGQFGSLNPQMAYNQGMEMLQQGWQNPFAQQPQDPGGNIRDLIQRPQPHGRYGLGLAEGAIVPRDMLDADSDGVVDYYQSGPGMPDVRMAGGKPEVPDARGGFTYPGQAQPAQDPYGSSTPYMPVARPSNRPPTAEQFRQQQTEIKQKEAVNDLYRRANLQPGASTDELMLGLINNSQGGTLVRPEALAGLPADIRGAVSQYQDLAGLAQSLSRPNTQAAWQRQQDVNAAVTQLKGRITERAQASQALQRDYGMSPADAAAWVNREMPMPDQAATMQGLQQKQGVYEEQERAAARAKLEKEWAVTPKGPSATDQWNQIRATTNTQTKPLSPAHQRVYEAMVAEQWKSRGRDDSWAASGSPLANMARAGNAKTGQGITGMEPRKR